MNKDTSASKQRSVQSLIAGLFTSAVTSGRIKNSKKHLHDLYDLSYRHQVLRLLLVAAMTICAGLGYVNLFSSPMLAAFELTFALYSFVLILLSRPKRLLFKISLLFLLALYSLLLFALAFPGEHKTAVVWILAIPVLSHFLLGRWYGLWISVTFIMLSIIIVVGRSLLLDEAANIFLHVNELLAALVILAISHVYEVSRVRAHYKLLHLATTDNLTSLANRTRFLDVFERERNHAERNKTPFSMLLIDLDDFKLVNDRYGHDVGDDVLRYVAASIQHRIRKTDLACRIGGEEFGILLPGADLSRAIGVAEDIRKAIADVPYAKAEIVIPLSVSTGVAEYGEDGVDLASLYSAADGFMYKAKAAGRNKTFSRQANSSHNKHKLNGMQIAH